VRRRRVACEDAIERVRHPATLDRYTGLENTLEDLPSLLGGSELQKFRHLVSPRLL
jgi:hypothetical protein